MKIQPQFTFNQVAFDKDTEAHLVIGLTAPAIDWQKKRQPVCIILCVDISGSMSGNKLHYAKQASLKLVEQLAPGDYAGLVTFSNSGRVDYAPKLMSQSNKDELRAVIGKMHTEGGTNFSDGMITAIQAAARLDLPASVLTRVVMLTDGQPTHGIALDSKSLNTLLEKQRGPVTLSAFGFGSDPDQDLLSSLSSVGKGNYAFIKDPDNALAAFGKELGGLLSTYAQSITVEVTPSNGHVVTEVLSDLETEEEVDGEVSIKVPSLLAEETNNLVLAVKLSQQKQAGPRQVNAFSVKVSYQRLAEDGSLVTETVEAKAKVQFVRADEAQKTPTKEVDEIVARAQLVKVQIEAEKAAQTGDFRAASLAFQDAAQSFQDRGFGGLVGATNHIGSNYSAAGVYAATQGRRTALRSATTRGSGTSSMDAADEAVLLGASYSVSNSAQEAMTQSFVGASPVPEAPIADLSAIASLASQEQGGALIWRGGAMPPTNIAPLVVSPSPAAKKKVAKAKSKRW